MSLTSATATPADGFALLDPAVPSAAAATQNVTTAMTAAQRGILKMCPSCYRTKSTVLVPCATDADPSPLLGKVSRGGVPEREPVVLPPPGRSELDELFERLPRAFQAPAERS